MLLDHVGIAALYVDAEPYLWYFGIALLLSAFGSILGIIFLVCSVVCFPRTRLTLSTPGDARPTEMGSRTVLHAPAGRHDDIWRRLRESLTANRAAVNSGKVFRDSTHTLAITTSSRLDISSSRFLSAHANFCCNRSIK